MDFEQLCELAMSTAHPDWQPETVRNILTVVQRPMWGARTLDAIAEAWPRFAAEAGAMLHSFPYKTGAWWRPVTSVVEELEHDTSTEVVVRSNDNYGLHMTTSCAPIAPADGIELPIDEFLDDDALGDLAAPAAWNAAPAGPSPSAQLAQLVESERALAERRRALIVELVLVEGWNYAHIGRALGITRQAAAKTYGPLVRDEMRKRAKR